MQTVSIIVINMILYYTTILPGGAPSPTSQLVIIQVPFLLALGGSKAKG